MVAKLGASLTEFTTTTKTSKKESIPPLAVPPLSLTVTVILAVPLALATGVYDKLPVEAALV